MMVKVEAIVEVDEVLNASGPPTYRIRSTTDSGIYNAGRCNDVFVEMRLCAVIPEPIKQGTPVFWPGPDREGTEIGFYFELREDVHIVTRVKDQVGGEEYSTLWAEPLTEADLHAPEAE